jgi:hypothetical protein
MNKVQVLKKIKGNKNSNENNDNNYNIPFTESIVIN